MDFVKIVPTGNIAAMMQLLAGESVYRIMRLRLANDESMLLEINYLPCNRFPEFSRQMVEHQSLYRVLQNRYALNIDVAEETSSRSSCVPWRPRCFTQFRVSWVCSSNESPTRVEKW